ncbi:MAG: histidine kinase [Geobacteraceae bacterium]|nr:histidine kinase [Geobacteraceae bacterium]
MSIKKTVAIAAAAGAIAAVSVPAMAFENEFHGTYGFNTTFSNFQNGGSGDYQPAGKLTNQKMNNYFEQRARLQYIAKASDDLKLVTHFEIDNRFGVGRSATAQPGSGASLDADSINLETKNVYLDFNLGKSFNAKLGIQPYTDTIKGLFITADIPAIMTTTTLGSYKLNLGFSRFDDDGTATTRLGDKNKDLFIMDNIFAFSKNAKAAFSYYFLADYAAGSTGGQASLLDIASAEEAILLHTLALSGEGKIGPATLSGFFAMQAGHAKNAFGTPSNSVQTHGWAANFAAKMPVGPGTAKTAFLFTSGNNADTNPNNTHYKGWITSSVNSYNEGGMMILARNTANSPGSTDRYIRRNVTNIAVASLGYDANLTDKLYLNSNVGFGWTPASGETANASDFMGTELNIETGYKVYSNLTLKAQAAYMILGGLYKDTALDVNGAATTKDPENPYTMRLLASFAF